MRQYVPLLVGWPILIWSLDRIRFFPDDIWPAVGRFAWLASCILLGWCVSELVRSPSYRWGLREQVGLGILTLLLAAIVCNVDQLGV